MAPDTRSRGVPAPSRVYHCTPALQQAMFPPRRKKVRTYGRQAPATLRQQTLTQIDFVSSFDEDDVVTLTDSEAEEMDKENKLPKGKGKGKERVGEGKEDEQPAARKGKRPATTKPVEGERNKRRRTLGDETEDKAAKDDNDKRSRRKTLGDTPASSTSKYHTQTLTQFLGQRSFIADSDDDLDLGGDSDEDDGFLDWLGEPGSPSVQRSQAMDRASSPHASKSRKQKPAAGHDQSREASVIPQTPAAKRTTTTIRFDVPPSGGLHSPSTARIDRYGPPDKQDSPLKDRSSPAVPQPVELTGVPRHLDATPTRRRKPPLVIQDSFATEAWGSSSRSQAGATPRGSAMNTPTKARRERLESAELGGPATSLASSGVQAPRTPSPRKQRVSPKKTKSGLSEIPDSDEGDDDFEEESVRGDDDEADDDGDGHFLAGAETQLVMSELASTEEQQLGRPSPALVQTSSTLSSKRQQLSSTASNPVSSTPTAHPVPPSSENQLPHPPPSHSTTASRPIRKPLHHPLSSQPHSQPFESQRVPLSILQSLPPHAARSDILLPIAAPALVPLLTGHAVHVAAPFKIPAQVVRFWLLDGDTALLRYMACVEPPGEAAAAGQGWQYHVSQVYELNNPMREADMREEGWVDGRIGKYVYLPPAVVGQLLWNLRHAIFGDGTDEEDLVMDEAEREAPGVVHQQQQHTCPRAETPAGSMTVSQQVAAQIHSDIASSTQFIPSTPDGDDDDDTRHHHHPASTPRQQASSTMKPPPSTTKPARTPGRTANQQQPPIHPSQATTASQSSTPEKPSNHPHPHQLPPPPLAAQHHSSTSSSSLAFLDHGASLVSLPPSSSIPASQLLTRSQMLPDSLVRDAAALPARLPVEIWDSDDDDAPL